MLLFTLYNSATVTISTMPSLSILSLRPALVVKDCQIIVVLACLVDFEIYMSASMSSLR